MVLLSKPRQWELNKLNKIKQLRKHSPSFVLRPSWMAGTISLTVAYARRATRVQTRLGLSLQLRLGIGDEKFAHSQLVRVNDFYDTGGPFRAAASLGC